MDKQDGMIFQVVKDDVVTIPRDQYESLIAKSVIHDNVVKYLDNAIYVDGSTIRFVMGIPNSIHAVNPDPADSASEE